MEMIIAYLQSGLSAIVPFVILLGLLIFVHELGHFLVAKYWGVRVEVFSMGFGKKILKYKRGDTTYCISLIPLGGYVKMFGDDPSVEVSSEDKPFSYTHKPVMQRISIVLAGPLMNFFFAILLFFIIAMTGEQMKAPILGDIEPDTEAFAVGFRSGDKILKAGGSEILHWDDLIRKLTDYQGQNLEISVEHVLTNSTETLSIKPKLTKNQNILSTEDYIGDFPGLTNLSKASMVGVALNSIAYEQGLRTGDLLTSINGVKLKYFRELENIFVAQQGQELKIELERFDVNDPNKSSKEKISFKSNNVASLQSIGIEKSELFLAKIVKDSPAEAAGLKNGDRVVSINGKTPHKWEDILDTVKSYDEKSPLIFEVLQGSDLKKIEVVPKMTTQMNAHGGEDKRFTVGIVPWSMPTPPEISIVKSSNLVAGLARGFEKSVEVTQMTIVSFLRLIQAKISPKNIGGVISIGQAAHETFKLGWSHFVQMMAVISINLFILNLLPVPVLDGGHLLFYSIEAIKGAPLSMRKMEIAQQIGLVVLMSLMVFALFNDVTRVFGSW